MLVVKSISDGAIINTLVISYIAGSKFILGVILPLSIDTPSLLLGSKPITGKFANEFGDHECNHFNYNGLMHYGRPGMAIQRQVDYVVPYTLPICRYVGTKIAYNRLNPTVYSDEYTDLTSPGVSGYIPQVHYINSDPKYGNTPYHTWYSVNWYWVGDTIQVVSSWHELCDHALYKINKYTVHRLAQTLSSRTVVLGKLTGISSETRKYTSTVGFPDNPEFFPVNTRSSSVVVVKNWGSSLVPNEIFLDRISEVISKTLPKEDPCVYGDLCRVAISDAHAIDINSIAYLKEALEMKDSFQKLFSLMRGKVTVKSIASLFLSFRYGLRLTAIDTKEIAAAAKRALADRRKFKFRYLRSEQKSSGVFTNGPLKNWPLDHQYNYKVYYDPIDNKILDIYRKLSDLDLFPSLQNVWDLVPFSFVVDWFLDFESLFDNIDLRNYVSTLKVHAVIKTKKTIIRSIPSYMFRSIFSGLGTGELLGHFSLTIYNRELGKALDLPKLQLDVQEDFRNFAELTAIIVTTVK